MDVNGWFDSLPPFVRHGLFMLAATLLAWGSTDVVPFLNDQPGWGALAGTLLAALIAYFTPATRQYGVGRRAGAAGNSLPR